MTVDNLTQFEDKCPECKSTQLEYGTMEPIDERIEQEVSCKSCKHDFVISIYTYNKWRIEP